jgi:hypothetical protein
VANWDSNSDPLSTAQQVKEQAKSLAHDAKEEASNVVGQARDQVQGLVSQQKDKMVNQLGSLAGVLRDTGNRLNEQDGAGLGRYAGRAADQVDRVSNYLRDRDLSAVIRDAETFARRRPDVFLGGTFLAGLILARFLKASGKESLETGAVRAGDDVYPRTGGTYARTGGTYARTGEDFSRTGESAFEAPQPYTPPVGG